MNLKEQKYVCTLAATGSISKAADLLGITPPALSLYISNVEKELGIKLFERAKKKFIPTHIGQMYISNAKKMLDLKTVFDHELANARSTYAGNVRIGLQSVAFGYIIPYIVRDYAMMFPHIKISILEGRYSMLENNLVSGNLDLILCNVPFRSPSFTYIPLFHDPLRLAVPKSYNYNSIGVDGNFPIVNLDNLKNETFILLQSGQSLRTLAMRLFSNALIAPEHITEVTSVSTAMRLTSVGYGISFCPQSYIYSTPVPYPITLLSLGHFSIPLEFSVLYNKTSLLPPYLDSLINICKHYADELTTNSLSYIRYE